MTRNYRFKINDILKILRNGYGSNDMVICNIDWSNNDEDRRDVTPVVRITDETAQKISTALMGEKCQKNILLDFSGCISDPKSLVFVALLSEPKLKKYPDGLAMRFSNAVRDEVEKIVGKNGIYYSNDKEKYFYVKFGNKESDDIAQLSAAVGKINVKDYTNEEEVFKKMDKRIKDTGMNLTIRNQEGSEQKTPHKDFWVNGNLYKALLEMRRYGKIKRDNEKGITYLFIGEGNFSGSKSFFNERKQILEKMEKKACDDFTMKNAYATEIISEVDIDKNANDRMNNKNYVKQVLTYIPYAVDATKLDSYAGLRGKLFQRVRFNAPYVPIGTQAGQHEKALNGLMKRIFASVDKFQEDGGTFSTTVSCSGPYENYAHWWWQKVFYGKDKESPFPCDKDGNPKYFLTHVRYFGCATKETPNVRHPSYIHEKSEGESAAERDFIEFEFTKRKTLKKEIESSKLWIDTNKSGESDEHLLNVINPEVIEFDTSGSEEDDRDNDGVLGVKHCEESNSNNVNNRSEQQKNPVLTDKNADSERHWYSGDEINQLLNKIFVGNNTVEILTDMLGNDWVGGNTLKEQLVQFKHERSNKIKRKENVRNRVIIPVNLGTADGKGMHWVLLYMRYNSESAQPSIIYVDPLGKDIPEVIRNNLPEIFPGISPICSTIKLQTDGCNCGPWVIAAAQFLVEQEQQQQNINVNEALKHLEKLDIDTVRDNHHEILASVNASRGSTKQGEKLEVPGQNAESGKGNSNAMRKVEEKMCNLNVGDNTELGSKERNRLDSHINGFFNSDKTKKPINGKDVDEKKPEHSDNTECKK